MQPVTEVTVRGILGGKIWMPAVTCMKSFKISNQEYPFTSMVDRPSTATLRDMILRATNDGDFQSAVIADAQVVFTRTRRTASGTITRKRIMDIRKFKSVADCVAVEESEEYYAIMDAGSEEN